MRRHPCWGCHILQERQTPNKLRQCLWVVLSPRFLPLFLGVIYFHTSSSPSRTHFSSCLTVPPPVSSSACCSFPPSSLLPLPLPSSLLGHVAAAPAEIIGAKAWGCYLHRNSMTPQAASGEGHRDHLSQNFNENFCWDRDFIPPTTPTAPPPLQHRHPTPHTQSYFLFLSFNTVPSCVFPHCEPD